MLGCLCLPAMTVPKYKSCRPSSLSALSGRGWRVERIVCEPAHIRAEQTSQGEVKIKLVERQLLLMNLCHNRIILSPLTLCFWSTFQVLSSSLCFLYIPHPSTTTTNPLFFPVIIPVPLQDCWCPQRECGMLEEFKSNRCLITVLITDTHTHTCYSDKQWQRW